MGERSPAMSVTSPHPRDEPNNMTAGLLTEKVLICASPNSIRARNGRDSRTQGRPAKVLRLGSKYLSSDRTKVERPAA